MRTDSKPYIELTLRVICMHAAIWPMHLHLYGCSHQLAFWSMRLFQCNIAWHFQASFMNHACTVCAELWPSHTWPLDGSAMARPKFHREISDKRKLSRMRWVPAVYVSDASLPKCMQIYCCHLIAIIWFSSFEEVKKVLCMIYWYGHVINSKDIWKSLTRTSFQFCMNCPWL